MRLEDKVALITASTRGIGLACVKACVKEGATFYMAARNLELAQEIADTRNAEGGRANSHSFRRLWSGHTGVW